MLKRNTANVDASTEDDNGGTTDTGSTSTEGNTPGLTTTENAVTFINDTVLNPSVTPMTGTGQTMTDQAAAMMFQDLRAFMQGNEQLLTAAFGKAVALAVDPATTTEAQNVMTALEQIMTDLTLFASDVVIIGQAITSGTAPSGLQAVSASSV